MVRSRRQRHSCPCYRTHVRLLPAHPRYGNIRQNNQPRANGLDAQTTKTRNCLERSHASNLLKATYPVVSKTKVYTTHMSYATSVSISVLLMPSSCVVRRRMGIGQAQEHLGGFQRIPEDPGALDRNQHARVPCVANPHAQASALASVYSLFAIALGPFFRCLIWRGRHDDRDAGRNSS